MLSNSLLEILCCPKCKGSLDYQPELNLLVCNLCVKEYPVKNDIPILIFEDKSNTETDVQR